MITIPNKPNFHIIENVAELPNLRNRKEIFCDVETKRVFDDKNLGGLYPWKGDRICGIAISADDISDVWYVPIRHTIPGTSSEENPGGIHVRENLPVENVMWWAEEILTSCDEWVNHNCKFDAMFFDVGDGVVFGENCKLIDTLVLAKLYYSNRFGYGLKPLCVDWLHYDTTTQDIVKEYLKKIKSKSYADVPPRILGEYACDDVQMNRELYRFLIARLEKRAEKNAPLLLQTEVDLTPVLFDMEKDGLRVDVNQCKIESLRSMRVMVHHAEQLESRLGFEFTNSNQCMQKIILEHLNLPVLRTIIEKEDNVFIDTGRPSFDKDAFSLYQNHPLVVSSPETKEIIDLISEYRNEQQFKSLFLDTFLNLNVDGIVHPSYNQIVRTGRLSCSHPNSQQQNSRSKKLILPHDSEGFVSNDYSQIEYRLIVHYCKIASAIAAYNKDASTDFHEWAAGLFGISRKSAKRMNFAEAYGMGRKATIDSLSALKDIQDKIDADVTELIDSGSLSEEFRQAKFNELCRDRALTAYHQYHATFPEIKATARAMQNVAKNRGFIFTAYGRQRHLPGDECRKAFNTCMQGGSADIIKERMVALSPRYNPQSRELGIKIRANVHDENLSGVPISEAYNPDIHDYLCNMLEGTTVKFRVPIKTGLGISVNNWSEAASDEVYRDEQGQFTGGKLR